MAIIAIMAKLSMAINFVKISKVIINIDHLQKIPINNCIWRKVRAQIILITSVVYQYCNMLFISNVFCTVRGHLSGSVRGAVRIFLNGESTMSVIKFW